MLVFEFNILFLLRHVDAGNDLLTASKTTLLYTHILNLKSTLLSEVAHPQLGIYATDTLNLLGEFRKIFCGVLLILKILEF